MEDIWQVKIKPLLPILSTPLLSIISMMIGGIIGNRSDAAFLSSWPLISNLITSPLILYSMVSAITAVPPILGLLHYKAANNYLAKLSGLDNTFIMLLANIRGLPLSQHPLDRLLEVYFLNTANIFRSAYFFDECHAVIYRPIETSNELVPRHFFNAPADYRDTNLSRRPLSNNPRSLEANVFLGSSCDPIIVHIYTKDEIYRADNDLYVFDHGPSHPPTHRALAAIRLPAHDDREHSVGVLCLYSMRRDAFDGHGMQQLIVKLAHRVSLAIQMEKWLS
jgi:hypothetical protein